MKEIQKVINGFVIIEDFGYINGSRRAIVICKVCKENYEVDPNKLIYRKHCGCIRRGTRVSKYYKSHARLVNCYKHMMARCYNKNNKDYYNYGEKGIRVCREWKNKVDNFCEWALVNGYEDVFTIDRIDNKKGYSPSNCQWSDAKKQGRNTSRNVLTMELAEKMREDKENMTYHQLANKYNVSYGTVAAVVTYRVWKP